jgi:rhamnose utilization protein RhaD (predicted bifunctional aldolase and dehydrogenase)
VTAEVCFCAFDVTHGIEAVSEYTALPKLEAFAIECWSLEEAKLKHVPKKL